MFKFWERLLNFDGPFACVILFKKSATIPIPKKSNVLVAYVPLTYTSPISCFLRENVLRSYFLFENMQTIPQTKTLKITGEVIIISETGCRENVFDRNVWSLNKSDYQSFIQSHFR